MRGLVKTGILILLVIIWVLAAGQQTSSAASFISTGDGGWEWQKPTPSGQWLLEAFFVDDKTGWVVGDDCTILRTTDGGKNWAPQ